MATRFPIRFTGLDRTMRIVGLAPSGSWVALDGERLRVRMGWAFKLDAARESIRDARRDDDRVWSWGVHGWRGRWLVNGSSSWMVRIVFAPPVRARTGPITVTVRELRVSVDDPGGLVAALSTRP